MDTIQTQKEEIARLRAALQKIKDMPYELCGSDTDTYADIYNIANDALEAK